MMSRRVWIARGIVFLAVALFGAGRQAEASAKATLYRDTYGVPHIYADAPAEAAYALGYAQAEDRLEDIYKNVRMAIGSMAEVFGPEHVEADYLMRVVRNAELCRERLNDIPAHIREMGEQFVAGVNAYIREHPERVPEYALDLEPWHCAAVGRAMILRWPLGALMDDLKGKPETPVFGSNEWAVAPSRSADGRAILLTDPHLTWESLAVFYEARVHAGDLIMNGFCLVGSPLIALGHGARVGWACTTGGPDTADVYMLKLRPGMPTQYEYEGQWKYLDIRLIRIPVKGEPAPRVMPAMYSMFGPLVAEPDFGKNVAYAGKTLYLDDMGLLEQTWNMITAANAQEFRQALAMNHLMEQNIMFADCDGNIGYVRVGRTPIRPDGFDWSKPVPGNTGSTTWLGEHGIDDLVGIMNPPQGYMQNCNISPQNMMENSPLTPDKYRPYIYNVSWDNDNPRGRRARQLLAADDSITKDEAMAIVMETYDLLSKPWQIALKAAIAAAGQNHLHDALFAAAVDDILAWNGQFTQDSTAAPVIERWRLKCQGRIDVGAIAEGATLSATDQTGMLDALAETLDEMKSLYGRRNVTWGDIKKVGRGDEFYPCDGADFGRGKNATVTLRTVEGVETPKGSGRWVAHVGSMSAMLMFFGKDGIESYTCIPWGQSAVPGSPHYMDQGRDLYSKRHMKATWFKKDELLQHLESEKEIVVP